MAKAAPDMLDRMILMTATTKTFNIAGCHSGNVIIPDEKLRGTFAARMMAMGISPNSFGMHMATAAYSPEGAAWVDGLMTYLDGNRQVFDAGIASIPGLSSMRLEATYLAWVDFAGTGMEAAEFTRRVEKEARIAANHGAILQALFDTAKELGKSPAQVALRWVMDQPFMTSAIVGARNGNVAWSACSIAPVGPVGTASTTSSTSRSTGRPAYAFESPVTRRTCTSGTVALLQPPRKASIRSPRGRVTQR